MPTTRTPFPMVDALARDWSNEPGGANYYNAPNIDRSVAALESRRPGIPSVYDAPDRQRTMMVIVPTWFVHQLAVKVPTPR